MGSIIGGLVFVIVALAIVYLCVKYFKAHLFLKIIGIFVAVIIFVTGLGGFIDGFDQINHTGDYSPQAIAESKHKAKMKAESKSESKASDESISNAKNKAKNDGVKDINDKIAQKPELQGLSVKRDKYGDNDYDVTVPDSALEGNNSQLREICKNIFTIIEHETGSDNPTVYYYDEAGNQVAHTDWDGTIKLDD